MGSWKWKVRKAAGSVIKHTFLGASIASDHMVTLVDLEKVLKETDAPYAPMTPEITEKAYEYMVKGKIGRIGSKLVKVYIPPDKLIWDGLKENLETLLDCYDKGDMSSERFRDAENEARLYLHATLAALIASSDDKLWEYYEKNINNMPQGDILHEFMKRNGLFRDLTYYIDPETGEKVEKTPHTLIWKNPASNRTSIKVYQEDRIQYYKKIVRFIPTPVVR